MKFILTLLLLTTPLSLGQYNYTTAEVAAQFIFLDS